MEPAFAILIGLSIPGAVYSTLGILGTALNVIARRRAIREHRERMAAMTPPVGPQGPEV